MELKNLVPWNWFRKEQEAEGRRLPVAHRTKGENYPDPLARYYDVIDPLFDSISRFPYIRPLLPEILRGQQVENWLKPSLDIAATDKAYTIAAELPGVDEGKVEIEVLGDTLTIRGQKEHEQEDKGKNYYCVERTYGAFQRQLSLPEDADADAIQAHFKKGVLKLTVPRRGAPPRAARRIEVTTD
jgi:HSP20 family protein